MGERESAKLTAPMAQAPVSFLSVLEKRGESFSPALKSQRVAKAAELAERVYTGRKHWTGVTLYEHVLGVLTILLPMQPDEDTVIACLLQHVLKEKSIGLTELEEQFGTRVKQLVSSIHLLSHVSLRSRRTSIQDLRLMLVTVSDDIRVLLVILCKRCFALEHLPKLAPTEQRRLSRDALGLFAPVAARLGIHTLKQRLESLAFPVVYPSDAEAINEQILHLQKRYPSFLDHAAREVESMLAQQGIHARVHGREKLPYSVFTKLRGKAKSSIESLNDFYALRVIVKNEVQCYHVLAHLHRFGRAVPNRFKDYIAFPKPNGYQSLHTTVMQLPGVPPDLFVEVQIRSEQMHREAELGVAAHWSYKEGGAPHRAIERAQLQQVLTSQHSIEDDTPHESLVDHIFVLTPKGDIIELPEGATPLDFAFQIHTNLGLSYRLARVNGSIVALDHELENGDVVEILTHSTPQPSQEWLGLLKLSSSRTRLRKYLASTNREKYVALGRTMFNNELKKRKLPILDNELSVLKSFAGSALSMEEREDLLVKIGQGSERASSYLPNLDLLRGVAYKIEPTISRPRLQRKDALIEVEGETPMPIRFAKCCAPVAEERPKIIGIISRGGDVVVHLQKCRLGQRGNPGRRIAVRWRSEARD